MLQALDFGLFCTKTKEEIGYFSRHYVRFWPVSDHCSG